MQTFIQRKVKVPLIVVILAAITLVALAAAVIVGVRESAVRSNAIPQLYASASGAHVVRTWNKAYRYIDEDFNLVKTCADPDDPAFSEDSGWFVLGSFTGTIEECMSHRDMAICSSDGNTSLRYCPALGQ